MELILERSNSNRYTLQQACAFLGISIATGRNWVKLKKLKSYRENGELYLLKEDLDKFQLSRRNKGRVSSRSLEPSSKSRELYANYISKKSPNYAAVSLLVNSFTGNTISLTALLCESFLKLLCDTGAVKSEDKGDLLRSYLEGRLDIGEYEWLICDLIGKASVKSLSRAIDSLPQFTLSYVPYEDTLGLIYLSLLELAKKRQQGRYYTPQDITDTSIETIHIARGRIFLDPCCGSGNFLLRLLRRGARIEDLYGCDLDDFSVTLSRINFALAQKCASEEFLKEHFIKCDTVTSKNLPRADVILGNPPWGSMDEPLLIKRYSKTLECAKKVRPCYADIFVERSLKLLDEGGIVQFVLPEALLSVSSHDTVRSIISRHARVKAVRYLDEVFHAVQCKSVVLTLEKTSFSGAVGDVIVNTNDTNYIVRRERDRSDFNFKITDQEAKVLEKMDDLEHCVKLRGHARFALGIVTGANNGALFDSRVEHSEPVLRGLDIEPFKINSPQKFIRFDLTKLQQVAPEELYRAPVKIVYRFIARYPIVAVDTTGALTLNSCNLFVTKFDGMSAEYIAAVLNSSAVRFYFEKKFNTIKVLKSMLEEVPIPITSEENQLEIRFLTEELNDSDENGRAAILKKIDRKIAEIYGLGKRGIKLISG